MRVSRILAALLLSATCWSIAAGAEEPVPSFGVRTVPEVWVPRTDSRDYVGIGVGTMISGLVSLPHWPWLQPAVDLGYNLLPVQADASLSLVRTGAGVTLSAPLGTRVSAFVTGSAGYFMGMLHAEEESTGGSFYTSGGPGISVSLGPRLSIGILGSYSYFNHLYDGLGIGLGTTVRVSGAGGGAIPSVTTPSLLPGELPARGYVRVSNENLDTLFPVLFKYYDSHPISSVTLENTESTSISDVEVRLTLAEYMDSPKLSARLDTLAPGETREVDLYALFNERVLTITEGTKLAAEVTCSYSAQGRDGTDTSSVTLELYDRNALRWDDDRKIAAFVTAKDEEVQRFAKNMASLMRDHGREAIDTNLQLAMVLFSALVEHGSSYVIDPSSAYEELSQNPLAVDYVQFPRQTLQFKGGDCDDLSATFCALLESVGVETAFITVPGHILPAFKLSMSARRVSRTFSETGDLIIRDDGSAWIPVEATLVDGTFLEAWARGARQWRENAASESRGFYPVRDAWRDYAPVAFNVSTFEIALPDREAVTQAFERDLEVFVAREMYEREQQLLASLRSSPNNARVRNRLAVLYARYGLSDQAAEQLDRVLGRENYVPALINRANLHFLAGETRAARRLYERAIDSAPESAGARLGLARTNYELENYGEVEYHYERLAAAHPDVAESHSYLRFRDGDGARAGVDSSSRVMMWEE